MKKSFHLLISIFFAYSLFAQHENCNHGDAPSLDSSFQGKYIHASNDALRSIGLKLADVTEKKFDEIVSAIGRIENIPENIDSITSRVAGRAIEVYAKKDCSVKKGAPICKVESFLAGNPPPSVVLHSNENGVVEILNAYKGSGIEAGSEVARVVDTSELYAVANVFESALSQIKKGDKARIKIEALGKETVVEGVLEKFGTSLNAETNTLPAYFLIKNTDGKIKNGMRAVFSIIANSKTSLTVPVEAISEEDGLNYAYVKSPNEHGAFERRHVDVGRQNDIEAEIKGGLTQGEKVAVKGLYQLRFFPRDNDPHNHSASHSPRESDAHSQKECNDASRNHSQEHKHSEDEHANDAREHSREHENISHDKNEHIEGVHEHSEADSFWIEYRQNFLIAMLAISLILNFVFAVASRMGRGKSK